MVQFQGQKVEISQVEVESIPRLRADLDATDIRLCIIQARYNQEITSGLLRGAWACWNHYQGNAEHIQIIQVPGSFEITGVANRLVQSGKFDALVALGAVIRGDTAHFEYVAGATSRGLGSLSAQSPIPIAFGVLTVDNLEQARARCGETNNKGWEAMETAIEMARLMKKLT